jgi:competence protein ComEC
VNARAVRRIFPYVFAISVWMGVLAPMPLPVWAAVVVLGAALMLRRPWLVVIAGFLAASSLASQSLAGLTPLADGAFRGTVTLVADPQRLPGRTIVDVDSDRGRMELQASGAEGTRLSRRAAGDRVGVSGRIEELTHPDRGRPRHVRARLSADSVIDEHDPVWWSVPVNAVRGVVLRGADPLPALQRPVYGGFVLGDDRGRSTDVSAEFEAAGLQHLLVVSGENVAFVLAVLTPILRRLRPRALVVVTLGVLLFFAAMTRFEPSVLRATVMASIAVVGLASGRPVESRRGLAVAVGLLVLVDPMLVHSLGFRLSVAASAGIVLLAPLLERRLRGPMWFRAVLSVTIAAQLAVAPLIVPVFGPMPLAAVPANVLAEPVAGFVMMWGCSGGLIAGLVGGPVATIIQAPTRLAMWWIMGVASTATRLPGLRLDLVEIAAIAVSVGAVCWWRRRRTTHGIAAGPG